MWQMSLVGLLLLTGCSKGDDGDQSLPMVKTQFNFSLPFLDAKANTRMGGDVVQKDGTEEEFRGMSDVKLFCFNSTPTQSSSKIGNIIEIKTSGSEVTEEVTQDDYSLCQEISIPVTTSYFGFYARANDAPVTHADKMKYGIIETVGLGRTTYQDNSTIRFKPVSICTSDDPFGGSTKGAALLDLLNDLVSTTASVAAPNDQWATVEDMYLNEAYQRLTALRALSSTHVQILLAAINQILYLEPTDTYGDALRARLIEKIASYCTEVPTATSKTITLKADYQGYPEDLHLPTGAARVEWDADQKKFVVPDAHAYGANINIAALDNYVYPMNLQYQVFSDIVASDDLVINTEAGTPSDQYQDWDDLLEHGYAGAKKQVDQTTMSVAMVKQVEYAVGRIALRLRLAPSGNIYDAKNQIVNVSSGFTLKGYLIGGQREVDYNFQPVAGSKTYAIYDSYLAGGVQQVKRSDYTETDYILGLGTDKNQKINMALELVNDGDNFWGADGMIGHGATFYLVAELDPTGSEKYSTSLNQIFSRDHATQVNLTITSLATATYGLPNLDIPHPLVGVSVNLVWEDGLWYEEIEL